MSLSHNYYYNVEHRLLCVYYYYVTSTVRVTYLYNYCSIMFVFDTPTLAERFRKRILPIRSESVSRAVSRSYNDAL